MKITLFAQSFFRTIVRNILLFCISVFLFSCGPARHVKEGEYLLTKIKVSSKKEKVINSDLKTLVKQKPNRKLLGLFKIYLGIYNLYYDKETSKLSEKLGEPPVIYDSTLHDNSVKIMKKYLNNLGYYENEVRYSVRRNKKRAKVTYHINKNDRYHIENIDYVIKDAEIKRIFFEDTISRKVKKGSNFDFKLLQDERKRIENLLKNNGYYEFSKEYVNYRVDTSKDNNSADVDLVIKQKIEKINDSTLFSKHQTFTINKIFVRMDYDLQLSDQVYSDTTVNNDIIFIEKAEKKFKYDVISRAIYIRPGQLYSLTKQEQSYRNLSSLGVFSYVSIKYEVDYTTPGNYLNVYIDLNPNKKKAYTILAEGTNNGGNFGVNGDISFLNRNTFKGAELFRVRINAGMEVQQILTEDEDIQDNESNVLPFNTVEFGPEISIDIPRFLLPFKINQFSNRIKPTTSFGVSLNYQNRPDYARTVTSTYVNYSWKEGKNKTHIIYPFELSFTKLDKSAAFDEVLETIENPFLRNSYTDNLILGIRYTFIFATHDPSKNKSDYFLRYNIESAGNLFSLFTSPNSNNSNEDGSVNIAGVRYAQFLRNDIDFRYYDNFLYSQAVYRIAVGMGLPYGNSIALPFEKSYFAGGANGIRAWLPRELGPGNLPDSANNVDQIGNLKIEANLEYRFSITSILEGALFTDLGNIWNFNQEGSREDTQFKLNKMWDGLAIGTGFGIRFNFSFFILRFDIATPLKDPARSNPNILKYDWNQTLLNFGIGYPF